VATTYRVKVQGVVPGRDMGEVATALSQTFKLPVEKLAAVLKVPSFVIQRGLNLADAAKYEAVLRQAGAACIAEAEVEEPPTKANIQPPATPQPNKKTLYQILGIEPGASEEEIAAAYTERLAKIEGMGAASYDPNALALLRQANEILSDPNRRSAYDASLSARNVRTPVAVDWAPEPTFLQVWGKWVVVAFVIIGLGAWWTTRSKSPPLPKAEKAQKAGPPPSISLTLPAEPKSAQRFNKSSNPIDSTTATSPTERRATIATAERSAENVFAEVAPSIALVNVLDGSGRTIGSGSGVVIENGVVLTNCHVAQRGATLAVKFGEKSMPATIQLADEAFDLCRLDVPELSAPAVVIGSVTSLRTGQRVFAIGAPVGLELTISEGIVSALREMDDGTVIQTTAPISPGSSGGGLFDVSGRLVGIVTFQHRYGQNLNFALPADWIGQMRARGAPVAARSRDQSPASNILGRWICREPLSGRTGTYAFEPDGSVNIAMTDSKFTSLAYRISGKVLQMQDADEKTISLMIEELTTRRMVLNTGVKGRRLACERP